MFKTWWEGSHSSLGEQKTSKNLTQHLAASLGWQVELQSEEVPSEGSLWKQPRNHVFRRETGWKDQDVLKIMQTEWRSVNECDGLKNPRLRCLGPKINSMYEERGASVLVRCSWRCWRICFFMSFLLDFEFICQDNDPHEHEMRTLSRRRADETLMVMDWPPQRPEVHRGHRHILTVVCRNHVLLEFGYSVFCVCVPRKKINVH